MRDTCLQLHRSTAGSVPCSCNTPPLYIDPQLFVYDPQLYVYFPRAHYRARNRTWISANTPIAVGIPVAVNVVHISDGEPLGPRWPVGRLVSGHSPRLGLSYPHNIPDLVAVTDMEEVD